MTDVSLVIGYRSWPLEPRILRVASGHASLKAVLTRLFGTDGVRGLANEDPITPASVIRLMESAIRVLAPGVTRPVAIIGRDTRASGELMEAAAACGLAGCGVDVLLAGVIPTPAVAYLTASYPASFGVVISASHNPFEDNGIKFFRSTGYKLSDAEESRIEEGFWQSLDSASRPTGRQIGRIKELPDALDRYVSFVQSTFPKNASLRGFRLALDLANGASHRSTPRALELLGAKLEVGYADPDGYNINENCGSTHPGALISLVRQTGADLGIVHDGDADRVLFCDEYGSPLDGDEIMAIIGADLLSRHELRANTIVATVMSNYGLDELMKKLGARVVRTKVGDHCVMDALLDGDLNFGGEQSGHIIFRDLTTTGDGLITALRMLSVLVSTGKRLGELRRTLEKYPQVQRNIPVRQKIPFGKFQLITGELAIAEKELAGKGRVLLRYSGTEPKARLLLEGPDRLLLEQLADSIGQVVQKTLGA